MTIDSNSSVSGPELLRPAVPRRRAGPAIGLVLAVLVSACSSGHADTQPTSTSTPAATTSDVSPAPTEQQLILSQYRSFWPLLRPASAASSVAEKRRILAPYASDPALKSLVGAFVSQNRQGQRYYGAEIVHPRISSLSIDRGIAVISDCQQSDHAGLEKAATGKPVTVGPRHDPAYVTMHRIGGIWKITFIKHSGGSCT
jgi:hypothetical protein